MVRGAAAAFLCSRDGVVGGASKMNDSPEDSSRPAPLEGGGRQDENSPLTQAS